MKSASSDLIAYLNAARAGDAALIMADCFDFALKNGTVLSYTNADLPIVNNGVTYLANSVQVDGLKFKCAVGLETDKQKITVAAKPGDTYLGVPFLASIQRGLLDGCEISRTRVFLKSWSVQNRATPIGSVLLFKGRVGSVDQVGRTQAEITVNSDLVLLDISMPRNLYAPNCQHVLYDSGCGLSRAAFTANGTVGPSPTDSYIPWTSASASYAQGKIVFTSGANAGLSATVKSATIAGLTLAYPLLAAPAEGDTFEVSFGCDHTLTTCEKRFNNLVNFRGFPFIPPATYAV